ncbi:MAG: hypothetical protein AAF602_25575 [Myxococcota bacterium]
MQWTLWSLWIGGCSWFGVPAEPPTPRLTMAEIPDGLVPHEGEVVELDGFYRAVSVADEWIRIIVRSDDASIEDTVDCFTNRNGYQFKGAANGEPIVVRGRVGEKRGKLGLLDCERVME